MKALLITTLAVLYVLVSYGQQSASDYKNEQRISMLRTKYNYSPQNSENIDYSSDVCNKYRGMKTTGIVLSTLGAGCVIAGVSIVAAANNGAAYSGPTDTYFRGPSVLKTSGEAVNVIGSLSMGAGIPLAVVGAVRSKRTCGTMNAGRDRAYLELQSDANGLGLAFKY